MEKAKKLKLRPSARDNRRYFIVECENKEEIERAILDYIGILGLAKAAYVFVKKGGRRIVGSCTRENLNPVLASLAYAKLKVNKVSGTLKGLGVQRKSL